MVAKKPIFYEWQDVSHYDIMVNESALEGIIVSVGDNLKWSFYCHPCDATQWVLTLSMWAIFSSRNSLSGLWNEMKKRETLDKTFIHVNHQGTISTETEDDKCLCSDTRVMASIKLTFTLWFTRDSEDDGPTLTTVLPPYRRVKRVLIYRFSHFLFFFFAFLDFYIFFFFSLPPMIFLLSCAYFFLRSAAMEMDFGSMRVRWWASVGIGNRRVWLFYERD